MNEQTRKAIMMALLIGFAILVGLLIPVFQFAWYFGNIFGVILVLILLCLLIGPIVSWQRQPGSITQQWWSSYTYEKAARNAHQRSLETIDATNQLSPAGQRAKADQYEHERHLKLIDYDIARLTPEAQIAVANIQAMSTEKIERFRQIGQLSGVYLQVLQNQFGVELTAQEAALARADVIFGRRETQAHEMAMQDRRLEAEYRLRTAQFDHDLERLRYETQSQIDRLELEFRYKYPSADLEAQHEMIRLKSTLAAIEHIMSIADAKQREIAFRQWEKTKK